MQLHHGIAPLRGAIRAARQSGRNVAVVPTMGNLHEGHLRLVDRAGELSDFVVCSLFVNPMQFGAGEDLESYPRTLEADREKLQQRGCHCLFAPTLAEIYPNGLDGHTRVTVPGLSERHCGAGRPGHFDGVATIVTKLFQIVQPDIAVFGEKDYQQLQIIRKMTRDLSMPVTVEGVPTCREENGLAMSSRNGYLSAEDRHRASAIHRSLRACADRLATGADTPLDRLEHEAMELQREAGLDPEYLTICDAETLAPPAADCRDLVILAAARLQGTRLIDNLRVTRATN